MISSELQQRLSIMLEDEVLDLEGILRALGGYYECPRDGETGARKGPLVGYAGRYQPGNLQYVGEIYLNFAPAERYAFVLWSLAQRLDKMLQKQFFPIDAYLGAPEGGKALAFALAAMNPGAKYVYPDRRVTALASEHGREVAELHWSRHELEVGDIVAIGEDLNNNFSTTKELIRLVLEAHAVPYVIVSFYNRSVDVTGTHYKYDDQIDPLPIVTLRSRPIPQYKQDDPFVAEDVTKGNVVWKPKPEWPRLKQAMGL